jgi:hypothetical protein
MSFEPLYWVKFGTKRDGVAGTRKVTLRGEHGIREDCPQQISITWLDDDSVEQTSELGHSCGEVETQMTVNGAAGEVKEKLDLSIAPFVKARSSVKVDHYYRLLEYGELDFLRVSETPLAR